MRLEDMMKNVGSITNKVIKGNCWEGQFNVLEGIQALQSKVNEIIVAINDGIIKGDKGDTPNVKVGETTQLDPNEKAYVTQSGDMLNPVLNFGIPKGDKGDKGDTGKASETINDNVTGLDNTWSSQKIVEYSNDMFNNLKDIQGVKYNCDTSYKVLTGTKNGVVKDLKLKGRSLVNLNQSKITAYCDIAIEPKRITYNKTTFSYVANTVVGREYTVIKYPSNRFVIGFAPSSEYMTNLTSFIQPTLDTTKTEVVKVVASDVKMIVYVTNESKDTNVVILEGDHTQNPPQYFEGIASVGNGNEIEVLSRKEDGNLFDGNWILGKGIDSVTGSEYVGNNRNATNYIFTKENLKQSGAGVVSIFFYDQNKKYLGNQTTNLTNITLKPNSSFIRIDVDNNVSYENFIIYKNNPSSVNKQDKKPILFKDTDGAWKVVTELRGVDSVLCDNIEYSKYNKKLDEITLDETLNYNIWKPNPNATETIIFYLVDNISIKMRGQYIPITNLMSTRIGVAKEKIADFKDLDKEGIGYWDNNVKLFVSIKKSQLETQDVAGFKKLLKKWKDEGQPLKVIYEKEMYEQYEVNPLEIESYDNETMILFNTGVIPPDSEFYVDSNLGSLMIDTIDRTSRLENEVFKVNTAILRGDMRTVAEVYYPHDFIKEEK